MADSVKIIKPTSPQTIPFNPAIPIYFMHTPDVTQREKALAIEAIEEILEIANVKGKIPIADFGVWRKRDWIDSSGKLVPHSSVDWYVNRWYNLQREQVDADEGARQLLFDPWVKAQQHYDVILTALDLYMPNTKFIVGGAHRKRGTIISVKRFKDVRDRSMGEETIKQEVYHEVGHVFDLPDENRGSGITYSLGAHCANLCAMRQGIVVPRDWINFVYDRKRTGQIYCNTCAAELKTYFAQ